MHSNARLSAVLGASVLVLLHISSTQAEGQSPAESSFPDLPLPPAIEGLIGLPQTYTRARSAYLSLIASEAEQAGLPPAVADAVVKVESGFNPYAVGGVGEVGLMQIRPQTAAMLGYSGPVAGLFEPETNIRLGVAYLTRAWQLAGGDLCRALMKYRAGWGEERMSPLSVEYCRRARGHLSAIGSPLGTGAVPDAGGATPSFSDQRGRAMAQAAEQPAQDNAAETAAAPPPQAPRRPSSTRESEKAAPKPAGPTGKTAVAVKTRTADVPIPPTRIRLAALDTVKLSDAQAQALAKAREQEKIRTEKRRRLWTEHEARMDAITAKLKPTQLKIMSGL